MLIVGESINSSKEGIMTAIEARDTSFFQELAQKQIDAGADYVGVNCGTMIYDEPKVMKWLVETIQEKVAAPLCIDSPRVEAMEEGLSLCKYGQPILDSITAEKERYEVFLPLILKYKPKVVCLCMDDNGMPESSDDRLRIARKLIIDLTQAGISENDIYLDPLIKPICTGDKVGCEVIESIYKIKQEFPKVHGICGLSNISYGMPNRQTLNQVFMIQAMTMGMDSFILDPFDKKMIGFHYASKALVGLDQYCTQYLNAHRSGLFEE